MDPWIPWFLIGVAGCVGIAAPRWGFAALVLAAGLYGYFFSSDDPEDSTEPPKAVMYQTK